MFGEIFESISPALLFRGNEGSTVGAVFSSSAYVGIYFSQELSPVPIDSQQPDADRRNQSIRNSQVFLDQLKLLSADLRQQNLSQSLKSPQLGKPNITERLSIIVVQTSASASGNQAISPGGHQDPLAWMLSNSDFKAKALLKRAFRILSIPALVIVDARKKDVIALDGRRALFADPTGLRFPWHLPDPVDIFQGQLLSNKKSAGETVDFSELQCSIFCLVFVAHWCPPCRSLVRQLKKMYETLKGKSDGDESQPHFEVIMCSLDRCEETFSQFFAAMPWLSFPYNDPRCIAASRLYAVQEIPTMLVLNRNGEVITRHGKSELAMDPEGNEFPWYPKMVLELTSHTATLLKENISFLLFTEGTKEDLAFAHTSLLPVAEECFARADSDSHEMLFFYCGEDAKSDIVWETLGLGDASLPLICITDPFTHGLYICEDPNVSESIIRQFVEKFQQGALMPSKKLVLASPRSSTDHNNGFSENHENGCKNGDISASACSKRLSEGIDGCQLIEQKQQRYCL